MMMMTTTTTKRKKKMRRRWRRRRRTTTTTMTVVCLQEIGQEGEAAAGRDITVELYKESPDCRRCASLRYHI